MTCPGCGFPSIGACEACGACLHRPEIPLRAYVGANRRPLAEGLSHLASIRDLTNLRLLLFVADGPVTDAPQ